MTMALLGRDQEWCKRAYATRDCQRIGALVAHYGLFTVTNRVARGLPPAAKPAHSLAQLDIHLGLTYHRNNEL
jgi:hypothetical protein